MSEEKRPTPETTQPPSRMAELPCPTMTDPDPPDPAQLQRSTDLAVRRRDARRALAECERTLRELLRGEPLSEGRELTLEGKITNALTAVVRAREAL